MKAQLRPGSAAFVIALGALSALPPLSIDASLPALPATAHAFAVAPLALQATLGGFMLAFAAGQLVWGPLSDRYGRRPTMMCGLLLYALAGGVCALANGVLVLILARCVQGFGACASIVSARAIVRDLSPTREAAAAMQGYVMAAMSVAPIVAPLLGAALLTVFDWRAIYVMLAVAGIALLALPAFSLVESAPARGRRGAGVASSYLRFIRLPRSLPLTVALAAAFTGQFAFISGSPFVLVDQYHLGTGAYAWAFALASAAMIVASLWSGRLARGRALMPERVMAVGALAMPAIGVAIIVAFFFTSLGAAAFIAAMALYSFAAGLLIPNLFAAGMEAAGEFAGVAGAVLGAAQMGGGAIGSTLVGAVGFEPSRAVAIVVAAAGLVVIAAYAVSRTDLGDLAPV